MGKAKSLVTIFLCALCWGPSFLFIKIALTEIPPIALVFLRVAIGFLILFAVCWVKKAHKIQWKRHWKSFLLLGILMNALPGFLINSGELYISSSLAGILNSPTLIFTAVLSHYFGTHDPLTKNKIFGIALGLAGLCVIFIPLISYEGKQTLFGAFLLILMCLSYGIGGVYARTHMQKNMPSLVLLTAQLAMASLILIPFALLVEIPFALPSPHSLLAALGLGVIGTAGGFYFYYKAIEIAGATYASLAILLVPILAMFFGAYFLHEKLTWNLFAGTALILIGVLAVNPMFQTKT